MLRTHMRPLVEGETVEDGTIYHVPVLYTSRREALDKGQRKYLGSICPSCGERIRYTANSNCQHCQNERNKRESMSRCS